MPKLLLSISIFTLAISQSFIQGVISSATFTFVNKCDQTVWPGILSNAGIAPLQPTGFSLQKGESKVLNAPSSWGGRFWGRTHCSEDSDSKFTCATGDCGSGKLECAGAGATPPATLAEFTLNGDGGMDFFDVSLVDGYNLPMLVAPSGGTGRNCTYTGCMVDLNGACPSALKVMNSDGDGVACKSACEAFGQEEYCCSGAYGTPDTCKPSTYSQLFKTACPRAYSYAYDDKTSTFTCNGADYQITFCPPSTTRSLSVRHRRQVRNRRKGNKLRRHHNSVTEWFTKAQRPWITAELRQGSPDFTWPWWQYFWRWRVYDPTHFLLGCDLVPLNGSSNYIYYVGPCPYHIRIPFRVTWTRVIVKSYFHHNKP